MPSPATSGRNTSGPAGQRCRASSRAVLSPSSVRLRRARWRAENLESRLPQYLRELTDRVTILLPGALAEIFPIHQVGVLAALLVNFVHIAFRLAVLDAAPMLHLSQLLDLLRGERELRGALGPRDDAAVDGVELVADVSGLRKVGPLAIGRQFLPGPHRLVEPRRVAAARPVIHIGLMDGTSKLISQVFPDPLRHASLLSDSEHRKASPSIVKQCMPSGQ